MAISAEDLAKLLSLARAAIAAEVKGDAPPQVDKPAGIFAEKLGCFVTLTNRGRLRGCIGTFQPRAPLGRTIVEMGGASVRDPRFVFDPITTAELAKLQVEVSILSPLQETSEPLGLQIGVHGIYIIRGGWAGCFLPEVATDMGWTAEEFLSQCCQGKAGLPADAWKQSGTKVYLFTSEKFGE